MVYSAEWFLDRRILWNTLYTSNSLCILSVFSEHSVTVPNFLAEISGMKFPSHSADISRNFPLEVSHSLYSLNTLLQCRISSPKSQV